MNKDCSIVRDLLPLYLEDMVSEDTAAYIKEHLENCQDCAAEYKELSQNGGIDQMYQPHDTDGVAVIKSVKRKIRGRTIIIACIAVLITLTVVFVRPYLQPTIVDYADTIIYSQEDMQAAVDTIRAEFDTWGNCKLLSVVFCGDDRDKKELEYINELSTDDVTYTECVIFSTDFRTPMFGGDGWIANERYCYFWYLGRVDGGNWEVVSIEGLGEYHSYSGMK